MSEELQQTILEILLQELEKKTSSKKDSSTKIEVLIKKIVDEAIDGDQRMMTNVLKFFDKLDVLKTQTDNKKEEDILSKSDEEIILSYYYRNEKEINNKINKLKNEKPEIFSNQEECNPIA